MGFPVWQTVGVLAGLSALLIWAYWTTLAEIAHKWERDPQYSHGFLVPALAALFLWLRRDELPLNSFAPNWWGLLLLVPAMALRLAGAYSYYGWFDHLSFVPMVAGVVLTVAGWPTFKWSWKSIAFLLFMIPLPYRLEGAMALPLQRLATVASTYALQTLGFPALAEGNVIVLDEIRIDVVDACSGLRMLVVFFALSVAVIMLIPRLWWERIVVVLSAVPIAIVSNIVRIIVTGVFFALGWDRAAHFVHDHAEWLMMPLALGMLWLVMEFLSHLFFVPEPERPVSLGIAPVPATGRVSAGGAAPAKSTPR